MMPAPSVVRMMSAMVDVSSYTMMVVGFSGALWFAVLFIKGKYENMFPAILCLTIPLLEISQIIKPEDIAHRNIAWHFNNVGVLVMLIVYSYHLNKGKD